VISTPPPFNFASLFPFPFCKLFHRFFFFFALVKPLFSTLFGDLSSGSFFYDCPLFSFKIIYLFDGILPFEFLSASFPYVSVRLSFLNASEFFSVSLLSLGEAVIKGGWTDSLAWAFCSRTSTFFFYRRIRLPSRRLFKKVPPPPLGFSKSFPKLPPGYLIPEDPFPL